MGIRGGARIEVCFIYFFFLIRQIIHPTVFTQFLKWGHLRYQSFDIVLSIEISLVLYTRPESEGGCSYWSVRFAAFTWT